MEGSTRKRRTDPEAHAWCSGSVGKRAVDTTQRQGWGRGHLGRTSMRYAARRDPTRPVTHGSTHASSRGSVIYYSYANAPLGYVAKQREVHHGLISTPTAEGRYSNRATNVAQISVAVSRLAPSTRSEWTASALPPQTMMRSRGGCCGDFRLKKKKG
jgi:hypothetical protein